MLTLSFLCSCQATLGQTDRQASWLLVHDYEGAFTPTHVLQKAPDKTFAAAAPSITPGFVSHPVWVYTTVEANQAQYLLIDNPMIKQVDFYLVTNQTITQHTSLEYLRDTQTRQSNSPTLHFKIPAGFHGQVMLRVAGPDALILPINWVSEAAISNKLAQKQSIGYGIFGAIAALIMLYLVYAISLRDKNYTLYMVYAFAVLASILRLTGLLYYWFELPEFFHNHSSIFETAIAIGAGIFTINFLALKAHSPLLYRVVWGMVALQVLCLLVTLAGYNQLALIITEAVAAVFIPTAIGISLWVWKVKKHKAAKYYLLSWCALFVGANLYMAQNIGLIQTNNELMSHAVELGLLTEMALLAVGLSKRVDHIRKKNIALQNENIKILSDHNRQLETLVAQRTSNLEAQNDKIREQQQHIAEINATLEEMVQLRTQQLEEKNKKLVDYAYFNAHNVRGPIARILGLTYLIQHFNEDPTEFIDKIDLSAKELDEVVKQINTTLSYSNDIAVGKT